MEVSSVVGPVSGENGCSRSPRAEAAAARQPPHLRRMRPVYRSRRDALLAALAQHLPKLEPAGIAAGLHLVTWLPQDLDEETVIAAAAREGVAVAAVLPYRLSPAARGGLIFGYSNLTERQIAEGVTRLARAISHVRNGTDTATTPST